MMRVAERRPNRELCASLADARPVHYADPDDAEPDAEEADAEDVCAEKRAAQAVFDKLRNARRSAAWPLRRFVDCLGLETAAEHFGVSITRLIQLNGGAVQTEAEQSAIAAVLAD